MRPTDLEQLRQRAIADYELSTEGHDAEFDSVAELAAELFDVPIALVTVLKNENQQFRGAWGIDSTGTPRNVAFCNRTVEQNNVFVVENASADPRYTDNPLVTGEPYIRFYAGVPIRVGDGIAIGSLCLIDRKPRRFAANEAKRLKMLAKTVEDIIELRVGSRAAAASEQSTQRQSELLRATIDHVQQGIAVFDAELKLVLWNEMIIDLLDVPRTLCRVGASAQDLLLAVAKIGTFGSGNIEKIVADLLYSIKNTSSRRLTLVLTNGRIVDAWRASIPDGRSIFTVQDVTEQRRITRLQDEFVSTVSHELRTPLTAIRGALAILTYCSDEQLNARGQQMLAIASKNVARLNSLIDDILDVEKMGSGALRMTDAPLDLRMVLTEAVTQNRTFASAHGVTLDLVLANEALDILGDAGRLIQALANLISNACKYSPRGGTVQISGRRAEKQAILSVEDWGPGIPLDFRPHIFGRFAQAGPDHQQGRAGSGLGLAITKDIVEQHRGEIGFESKIGKGSCFKIFLPLLEARI